MNWSQYGALESTTVTGCQQPLGLAIQTVFNPECSCPSLGMSTSPNITLSFLRAGPMSHAATHPWHWAHIPVVRQKRYSLSSLCSLSSLQGPAQVWLLLLSRCSRKYVEISSLWDRHCCLGLHLANGSKIIDDRQADKVSAVVEWWGKSTYR